MSIIKDLEQLKKKVEQLLEEKHRAEGRLQETQDRLQREFKVSTLPAAKKLLKELEEEEEAAQREFDSALAAFNEEWGDKLS